MAYIDEMREVAVPAIEVQAAHQRLAQWGGHKDKVLAISVIGDSYSAGQDFYLNQLTQRLAREFGFAGPGYVGFNHGAALGGTNIKYTRSSEKYFGGDWDVSSLGQASPDSRTITGHAGSYLEVDSNETAAIDTSISQARLLYLGNGKANELRYRWGSSDPWRSLTLAGQGVQAVQLADVPAGAAWALRLEVVEGAPTLFGLWMSNDRGGIRVSKLAASGAASADFYKSDGQWQAQWKAVVAKIPADAYLIMLGGNDQGFGVKPKDYLERMKGLARMIREVHPMASINVIMRQDTTRSSAYPMSDYAQVLEPWARSQNIAYASLQCTFGPDFKRYASNGPTPMIGPDNIHPIPASGGRLIADFFYRLIVDGASGARGECGAALK
ncbi:SGNH/GDSL hydrolase family protein [Pseudomonas sp. PDM31]|uniref:SGNH/GDSL hydrolase family protein n=1 Tax=Pseudomonas sp. PDM31 TaxID=2854778 RepID=UPI001C439E7F|nr:SGNH/GDSL hydrolase family protein [Pseudomonas sp. PDM31]MBV7478330.1 SGNH/GDSL hydrolase family protein [Pseudomonas sp. PDM31]